MTENGEPMWRVEVLNSAPRQQQNLAIYSVIQCITDNLLSNLTTRRFNDECS